MVDDGRREPVPAKVVAVEMADRLVRMRLRPWGLSHLHLGSSCASATGQELTKATQQSDASVICMHACSKAPRCFLPFLLTTLT